MWYLFFFVWLLVFYFLFFFFFQAEDGIRDLYVTEFRRVLFRSSHLHERSHHDHDSASGQDRSDHCEYAGSTARSQQPGISSPPRKYSRAPPFRRQRDGCKRHLRFTPSPTEFSALDFLTRLKMPGDGAAA